MDWRRIIAAEPFLLYLSTSGIDRATALARCQKMMRREPRHPPNWSASVADELHEQHTRRVTRLVTKKLQKFTPLDANNYLSRTTCRRSDKICV